MSEAKLTREAIARIEIGHTDIGGGLARVISIVFLVVIFCVPVVQFVLDGGRVPVAFEGPPYEGGDGFVAKIDQANKRILKNIDILENDLEERSFLRQTFLPPLQYVQARFLGQGNEKVVLGRNGELFYRPSVEYLLGAPFLDPAQQLLRAQGKDIWEKEISPDPVASIVRFRDQLAERGVELIILPVPVKAAIRSSALGVGRADPEPLANRSWEDFLDKLGEESITVFDVRETLFALEQKSGKAYLPTDTHWTPEGMAVVAKQLGKFLLAEFPDLQGGVQYESVPQHIVSAGDISRMLKLPAGAELYKPVGVEIYQVVNENGEFWQPARNSPVLLLGDSFTNIYSAATLDWGSGAGLAEQLSRELLLPVDLIARNDSGAYATREILAQDMARGRDRLAGKEVVVWEFAERELAFGDWRNFSLDLGTPAATGFFTVEGDNSVVVTATVQAISRSPRPGSVPYRDNLITLHLVDLQGQGVGEGADQALVYALGMRDNELTKFATVRVGDSITLTLSSWDGKEAEYGSIRRTPLDDEMLELELPNWGEFHE